MANYRVNRLAGEVQREIAEILNQEVKDPRLSALSVVNVDIAPDGCAAKIYLSAMPGLDYSQKEINHALDSAKGYVRRELGKRLKTRVVPELYFYLDDSISYGVRMMKIIDEQIASDEAAAANRPEQEEGVYKEEI